MSPDLKKNIDAEKETWRIRVQTELPVSPFLKLDAL